MSNQPHGSSYEGYDPYQQQPGYQHQQTGDQQTGDQQPGWQGYDEAQAQQQHTQQWDGRTWETQVQPPAAAVDVTETAYLPPQSYGQPQPQAHGAAGQPLPPEAQGAAGQAGWQQNAAQQHGAQQYAAQHQGGHQYGAQQHAPQQYRAQQHAAQSQSQQPPQPQGPQPQPGTTPQASMASASGVQGEPAYGPPTVTGNARITDAQRARAEGRSPIIEPGVQPALITAVLGALLSVTAAVGQYAVVVPLVILQAVTAAGWFRLNGMWPARQGIALAFAGALTADAVLLAAGRENAPTAILGTLGVWVLLAFVLQLRSHADPDERMYGLMATVASAALSIVAAGHLAAAPDAVTVGAAAVAAAIVVRALPLPTAVSAIVALLAGAGAGAGVGSMTELGTQGAFLGLGAAVCALVGHRVAGFDYPSRFVHMTAGVALPLTAAAPAVYLLGRALG